MKPRRILNDIETAYLRKAWPDPEVMVAQMALRLGMCEERVRKRAREMDLGARPGISPNWPAALVAEVVRLHQAGGGPKQIGQRLGLSKDQVYGKLNRMGLIRSAVDAVQPDLTEEQLARLRRVARWDEAARHGLEVYEQRRAACGSC